MDKNGKLIGAYADTVKNPLNQLSTKNGAKVTLYAVWEKVVAEKPVVKVTRNSDTSMTVNTSVGESAADATYEIQYSTSIMFRNAKTVETSSLNETISGLQADKTYYVRVRQIKTYTKTDGTEGTGSGSWSKRAVAKTSSNN